MVAGGLDEPGSAAHLAQLPEADVVRVAHRLAQPERAARLEHPPQLGQRGLRLGHFTKHSNEECDVDGVVLQRQPGRIANAGFSRCACLKKPL